MSDPKPSEMPERWTDDALTEQARRIYYQSIVYDVCNLLDRASGKRPGTGIVCGTKDSPTHQTQDAVAAAIAENAKLREALNFYADDKKYDEVPGPGDYPNGLAPIIYDAGETARAAMRKDGHES